MLGLLLQRSAEALEGLIQDGIRQGEEIERMLNQSPVVEIGDPFFEVWVQSILNFLSNGWLWIGLAGWLAGLGVFVIIAYIGDRRKEKEGE